MLKSTILDNDISHVLFYTSLMENIINIKLPIIQENWNKICTNIPKIIVGYCSSQDPYDYVITKLPTIIPNTDENKLKILIIKYLAQINPESVLYYHSNDLKDQNYKLTDEKNIMETSKQPPTLPEIESQQLFNKNDYPLPNQYSNDYVLFNFLRNLGYTVFYGKK